MSAFLQTDKVFRPHDSRQGQIVKTLPPAIYVLKIDTDGMYFLQVDEFSMPKKLYGDTQAKATRILNTFSDRPGKNTGVLLAGEKGTGKTLLAKHLIQKSLLNKWPTVIINTPFTGEMLIRAMEAIIDPCLVFFDEFEKVYDDKKKQAEMLSFMDGTSVNQKLIIITCNDEYSIDKNMINRPGRLYYFYNYRGLDEDFITEYCKDHLDNHDTTQAIVKLSRLFNHFSFDNLQAMVEEINRYGETPSQVMEHLNIKPYTNSWGIDWKCTVTYLDGSSVAKDYTYSLNDNRRNPLTDEVYVYVNSINNKDDDSDTDANAVTTGTMAQLLEVQQAKFNGHIKMASNLFYKSLDDGSLIYKNNLFIFKFTKTVSADLYSGIHKSF